MTATLIIVAVVSAALGGGLVMLIKMQASTQWSNKEFDGTMFIGIILIAFCGTLLGTYLKESFALLETTKTALDLFENLFMIIVGYLFKKAVDVANGAVGGNTKSWTDPKENTE